MTNVDDITNELIKFYEKTNDDKMPVNNFVKEAYFFTKKYVDFKMEILKSLDFEKYKERIIFIDRLYDDILERSRLNQFWNEVRDSTHTFM